MRRDGLLRCARNDGKGAVMARKLRTSLFSGPDRGLLENVVLRHDNGMITSISEGAPPTTGPRSLVLPAFVNAHDHARPTASSFGALGMPLESWILRSALGTPVDPYLTAASALARSARAGCASMMVHYTRRAAPCRWSRKPRRSRARRPMSASASRLRLPCVTRTRSSMATASRCCPNSPATTARRSRKCSSARRCRPRPISN